MPGTKFKLDHEQNPVEDIRQTIYICQDCKEKVGYQFVESHAVKEHKATSILIDTNFEKIKGKNHG